MQFEKTIEQISDTSVRLTVTVKEGEKIRNLRIFNLVKMPSQDADAVCREACPEAFVE